MCVHYLLSNHSLVVEQCKGYFPVNDTEMYDVKSIFFTASFTWTTYAYLSFPIRGLQFR